MLACARDFHLWDPRHLWSKKRIYRINLLLIYFQRAGCKPSSDKSDKSVSLILFSEHRLHRFYGYARLRSWFSSVRSETCFSLMSFANKSVVKKRIYWINLLLIYFQRAGRKPSSDKSDKSVSLFLFPNTESTKGTKVFSQAQQATQVRLFCVFRVHKNMFFWVNLCSDKTSGARAKIFLSSNLLSEQNTAHNHRKIHKFSR